jgi:hypothetical protein
MNISQLIGRAIEQKQNLTPRSYEPKGILEGDLCLSELTGKGEEIPNTSRIEAIDDLETVIFQGTVVFMYDAFNTNGIYFHAPVINPTIVDLQIALDAGLKHTKSHSYYLEFLYLIRNKTEYFKGIQFQDVVIPELGNVQLINIETGS